MEYHVWLYLHNKIKDVHSIRHRSFFIQFNSDRIERRSGLLGLLERWCCVSEAKMELITHFGVVAFHKLSQLFIPLFCKKFSESKKNKLLELVLYKDKN